MFLPWRRGWFANGRALKFSLVAENRVNCQRHAIAARLLRFLFVGPSRMDRVRPPHQPTVVLGVAGFEAVEDAAAVPGGRVVKVTANDDMAVLLTDLGMRVAAIALGELEAYCRTTLDRLGSDS